MSEQGTVEGRVSAPSTVAPGIVPDHNEAGPVCNICGGSAFEELKGRGRIRCTGCRSIERTRVLAMYLDRFAGLRPGQKVLHFAPEPPLFAKVAAAVGETYEVCDLHVNRYAELEGGPVSVRRFDLCTDSARLPSGYYDLILHNHVMEHIPCNVTAVLWHLHRALKEGGLHMFSVPIAEGSYEESLADLSREERTRRFHQWDHLRAFGRDDLLSTLGMVFDIEQQLETTLADLFGEAELRRFNIPQSRWRRFTGANLFVLRKQDLKLRAPDA